MRTVIRTLLAVVSLAGVARAQVPVEIVHSFAPSEPSAAQLLVLGGDGAIYGASHSPVELGGASVFRVAPDGQLTWMRSLSVTSIVESERMLYMSSDGGDIFRMRTDNSGLEVLYTVGNGLHRPRALARGTDGTLYGFADDGAVAGRVIFKLDPQKNFTILHTFASGAGRALLVGHDGNVYGLTRDAGATVFRITPAGTFSIVGAFGCVSDGACEPDTLRQAAGGDLYLSAFGTSSDQGGMFRLTLAGVGTRVCSFTDSLYWRTFALAADGNIYTIGTRSPLSLSPETSGVLYRVTPTGTVTPLHAIVWPETWRLHALVPAPDGSVYAGLGGIHMETDGSTVGGDWGRIARFTTDGAFSVFRQFAPPAEGMGRGHMILASDGAFYGTMERGGQFDRGTVFRVTAAGAFAVVHSFTDVGDGAQPKGIAEGQDGHFYLATSNVFSGGRKLIRLSVSGEWTVLPEPRPLNAVKAASDGYLYGVSDDSVYRTTLAGTVTSLRTPSNLAWTRWTPFVEGGDGSLYGTAGGDIVQGNTFVTGSVFRVRPDGGVMTLHTFAESGAPGPIAVTAEGDVYGFKDANFYRLSADGGFTVLHTFEKAQPGDALILAADGDFYGGVGRWIYRITPAGVVSVVHEFSPGHTIGTLLQAPDGTFYGTLSGSGSAAVFRFETPQIMSLDIPGHNTIVAPPYFAGGWAIDRTSTTGTGVDAVHVWAFPETGGTPAFLGAAGGFGPRADVGSIYGDRFAESGYHITLGDLTPGTYTLVAYARSTETGTFNQSRAATVTVPVSHPIASIDVPADGTTVANTFYIAGWAIDAEAPSGTGVAALQIYAIPSSGSPIFLGQGSYGGARPDVGAMFGSQFTNSGFQHTMKDVEALAPGTYTLVLYFRSTVTGAFSSTARTITVRASGDPLIHIDTPRFGASVSQPFLLAGWSIDRDAPAGTGIDAVHVWAFPPDGGPAIFLGAPEYGFARPDVGAMFGSQFTPSGYNLSVSSLPPGSYQIIVYARSTVTGSFSQSVFLSVSVNSP